VRRAMKGLLDDATLQDPCAALGRHIQQLMAKCVHNGDVSDDEDEDEHLTEEEVLERQEASAEGLTYAVGQSGMTLRYAWLTQRGFYPDDLDKNNQDACKVIPTYGGNPDEFLMAVFDGHGKVGDQVAYFARDHIEETLAASRARYPHDLTKAHDDCFKSLNGRVHGHRDIDDTMSGTTAVSAFIKGRTIHVANIGDSRVVLGEMQGDKLVPVPLSIDQTPFRRDERERIREAGGLVCSHKQLSGTLPMHDDWGDLDLGEQLDDSGDPPRVWKSAKSQIPGCAFTRSLGDAIGEEVGVNAEAEQVQKALDPSAKMIILASDGVWEFMTNHVVIEMIAQCGTPLEACRAVVAESYRLWLQHDIRTDDITAVIAYFEHDASSSSAPGSLSGVPAQPLAPPPAKVGFAVAGGGAAEEEEAEEEEKEQAARGKGPGAISSSFAAMAANADKRKHYNSRRTFVDTGTLSQATGGWSDDDEESQEAPPAAEALATSSTAAVPVAATTPQVTPPSSSRRFSNLNPFKKREASL